MNMMRNHVARWSRFALLLALSPLAGCVSLSQSEIKFLETRQLRRPFDESYNAALNAVFGLGYSITHTDKHSGVIVAQSGDYALQDRTSKRSKARHPVKKITLMLTPRGPALTQLRMKVVVNEEPQLDRKLMTQLWQRIDREAMLDAPPPRPRPAGHRAAR